MNLPAVQAFMRERSIDAWLLYDFRQSNPVLGAMLPGRRWTTRRALLFIPAAGEPRLLAHSIDAAQFDRLPAGVARDLYLDWHGLHNWLARRLAGCTRVAMEYSPGGALPAVSFADAGTVELVRAQGGGEVEVVSSADLIQVSVATWSDDALRSHAIASERVARVKDGALALIRDALAQRRTLTERQVQQHVLAQFAEHGLETPEPPIVAVNEHSGDPHFEVPEHGSAPIRRGDWILLDLWARLPGDENIFADITWTAFAGAAADVPARHRTVFDTVRAARDAAVRLAQESWQARRPVQGWQLDDAARKVIVDAGFGEFLRHRTGHSLSPGPRVHGLGVNLDNLETHDTREILPRVGWTVEPGIYIPGQGGFGVRNEINMFADPAKGPIVTSCIQDELVLV
jgi:Xaa-Pro aminopeptidase